MNASDILSSVSKIPGCNTVKIYRISGDDIYSVPGELIGFNRNVGSSVSTNIMAECLRQKKRAIIDTAEIIVTDYVTLERDQIGDYKCYSRITHDVVIDTTALLAVAYSEDSSIHPRLVSSGEEIRFSNIVQRSLFRFGNVKLVVEIDQTAKIHIVYCEFKVHQVNPVDIDCVLKIIGRKDP
jgi:hypothetical protein